MRNKMLRSVLVAAFSTVVALGALGGLSNAKGDARANTQWPSVAVSTEAGGSAGEAQDVTDGAGS